ncbi:MAG: hypothetical protein WA708_07020 [Acidobacteriaceae bacterium]
MKNWRRIAAMALALTLIRVAHAAPRTAEANTSVAQDRKGDASAPRYQDTPDLKALLPRFLTKQGLLDPEFSVTVGKPSPYYTDFYGVQALADMTKGEIQRDFVPEFASLIDESEHSITLRFKEGYTAKFYPHSALVVKSISVPFDHVYISGDTWRTLEKNLDDFRGIILANRWQSRYLIPNPEYNAELAVAAAVANPAPIPVLTVDPDLKQYEASCNAVLIVPEGVHGVRSTGFETLYPLLNTHQFDWLGMEMLPSLMQSVLDNFTRGEASSPAYNAARKTIIQYFANAWNGQAGQKTSGEDNYYFQLVNEASKMHVRLIGMESSPIEYDLFRYGESAFGAEVRTYLWTQRVPVHGRGVVYGGSAHFTSARPVNFQNFLERRNSTVKFFILKPLHMTK